jgi:hypothetical protein
MFLKKKKKFIFEKTGVTRLMKRDGGDALKQELSGKMMENVREKGGS